MPLNAQLMKPALDALYYTGTYRLFKPAFGGVGAIFMLHHVRPTDQRGSFSPNRILEVTPEFLEETIQWVLAHKYQIVSLDEAHRRLTEKDFRRRFACFTLDDGYLDNYVHALPVFQKYRAPFAVYINTGLPDGSAVLWWWLLEEIVRDNDAVEVRLRDREVRFATDSLHRKIQVYNRIYWALRSMAPPVQRATLDALLDRYHIDPVALCRSTAMSWDTIAKLTATGLVTLGAHTISHPALNWLSPGEIRHEAAQSQALIAERTGKPVRHFAYPYGDSTSASRREFRIIRDLGFTTATTTRKGVLFPEHAHYLEALPRVTLHGSYQHLRYIELYLSGAPVALWRGFQRLDVG